MRAEPTCLIHFLRPESKSGKCMFTVGKCNIRCTHMTNTNLCTYVSMSSFVRILACAWLTKPRLTSLTLNRPDSNIKTNKTVYKIIFENNHYLYSVIYTRVSHKPTLHLCMTNYTSSHKWICSWNSVFIVSFENIMTFT